jgi:hypothetical protein
VGEIEGDKEDGERQKKGRREKGESKGRIES